MMNNLSFFSLRRCLTVGALVGGSALVAPAQANAPPREVLVRGGGVDVELIEPHGCTPEEETGDENHPCPDPSRPADRVGLRPGGRVYVRPNFLGPNFSSTKLTASVHDVGEAVGNRYVVRTVKLVAIRRKRGWTLSLPARVSPKANSLVLRFYKDGRLTSQWTAPVERVSP
jgi:hypothetical protein